ncbi:MULTISPECIES: hypothetical protein [Pseudoalteromonas]|jgi:predicted Zn-dependent protease|uniref:hypothetical protein n=1 Tax=Pseudoalteromonas TaxID=53246 RepID=UPI000EEA1C50|nr:MULTISPECIES: hypothetical protein [unclassified Pseudoalteromonas]MCF2920316.1 hypothetical protein [Pseudoalteromonas sp. APAL1]TMO46031.1 hypothetical protein CWC25_04570 [Pseudoalteromonas sp. S4389]HCV03356.1 hypothetical protein [Pseudoalteromonas sp.]
MKMSKQEFEQFLNDSLNQKQDISPDKDLWPGIERAIAEPQTQQIEKPTHGWNKLAAVAACCIAALLTVQLFVGQGESNSMMAMSDYFTKQKQGLLVQYQNQPALTDNWQQQLKELEEAESAIKQALENEPENPALLQMLSQVYQQQLDLINKVHAPKWQTI